MNTFISLNIDPPGSPLPTISAEDVVPFTALAEKGAWDHWDLGGSSASLTGIYTGSTLTELGTSPTYETDHIVIDPLNALALAMPDQARFSVALVMKKSDGAAVPFGNRQNLLTDGLGLLWSGHADGSSLRVHGPPSNFPPTGSYALTHVPAGGWFFAGFSWDDDGDVVLYAGGKEPVAFSTEGHTVASRALALGNAYYNTGAYATGTVAAAELVVWADRAITEAEWPDIYARSKVRMSLKGITLT